MNVRLLLKKGNHMMFYSKTKNKLVYTGKWCHYCDCKTELIDSAVVYGSSYGWMYRCPRCKSYVGCHRGTKRSLGIVANKSLRTAKKKAHEYFDQIALTELIHKIYPVFIPNLSSRNKAYFWLAKKMRIDKEFCHIGMFTELQCYEVVGICKKYLED